MAVEASTDYTLRQWAGRLVTGRPHLVLGGDDPHLLRWYLIPRNTRLNVYLHKFLRSDDDRALHDHPWWFVSWIVRGTYDEHTPAGRSSRRRWSVAYRPALWRHRVALTSGPAVTIVVTGRKSRMWGFWCAGDRFVRWDEWDTDTGCDTA